VVADEGSAVGNGDLMLGDALVEGQDVLFDMCTPVAGLDELPHLHEAASMLRSPRHQGRSRGCDALVVGERVALHRRLAVQVGLAMTLPPDGVVEPLVAHKAEFAQKSAWP